MRFFKQPQTPYRLGIAVASIGLFVVATLLGFTGREALQQYRIYNDRKALQEKKLAELQRHHTEQSIYLRKVVEDPAFREHVIRQRLGYSREGEVILKFAE